ncbi:MAG: 5-(carboxyamino)imidazole ribonucleotide synthase [Phycisphaeraceae bacterium]|nr:MAG: 5-(carboxyamino)imidazole ribonucleotide synthase [Phycisphaeraceae bacterium]
MTIGILGAGQLGRMLALAGLPLGVRCRFLDAKPNCPASPVGEVIHEGFKIGPHLDRFADGIAAGGGVITYEFENVPVEAAEHLTEHATVRPSPRSLEVAQDRLRERELFASLRIDAPRHAAVHTLDELEVAVGDFPLPAILKTCRMGYDGKGQARIKSPGDAAGAWETIGGHHSVEGNGGAILDEMIPFERELSVVAVRGIDGEVRCYPPVENMHRDGILVRSIAPAPGVGEVMLAALEKAAAAVAEELDHVGVLAVEFFETKAKEGRPARLLANEFAPRVHNTGHWTIEGAATSQFENHLRAVLAMPLGSTEMMAGAHAAMVNIIGGWPDREALLRIPGLRVHDYEKSARPGRKLGHVTIVEASEGAMREKLGAVEAMVNKG